MISFLYYIFSLRRHVDHVQRIALPSGLTQATGVYHQKLHFIPLLRILYSTSDHDENLHKLQEAKSLNRQ